MPVPIATNSSTLESHSIRLTVSRTPTMPSAPIVRASRRIRSIASARASYIAVDSVSSSWLLVQPANWTPR